MRQFQIMGVVNITPDSFSDGGRYLDLASAVSQATQLVEEGASILDFGGESTRPGAEEVPEQEELRRVVPVIESVAKQGTTAQLSVDTSKLAVASAAVDAGATYINDVTAFRAAPEMAAFVAERDLECCLMHMRGTPRTMQDAPRYDDVVSDVKAFLEERLAFVVSEGVAEQKVMLDPGIGFGKTVTHNLQLICRLDEIAELGCPLVVGTSRKSFIGQITGKGVEQRLAGTIASSLLAYERGAAVLRVHDVAPLHDALTVAAATVAGQWSKKT